jgi:hypothetical protein
LLKRRLRSLRLSGSRQVVTQELSGMAVVY